jgi:hypothetical protein
VIHTVYNAYDEDINQYVKMYIRMYGMECVRGGTYCDFLLSPPAYEELLMFTPSYEWSILDAEEDDCVYEENDYMMVSSPFLVEHRDTVLSFLQPSPQNAFCIRCRTCGHYVDQCFARDAASKKVC